MFKAHSFLVVAALVLAGGSSARAQSTASVEEQFAAYHQALRGTADNMLKAPAEIPRPVIGPGSTTPSQAIPVSYRNSVARVQQLRTLLEPILREEGVPTDVVSVVLVESGGRTTALSPKGALGLWQLMPETARRYGLTVSAGRDERIDPVKATRAAVRYLRDLYVQFGDWQLAVAAYNAGEKAVQRAIVRSGSNDFRRLNAFLPFETKAYVPAVMKARTLFNNGQDFSETTYRAARRAQVLYARAVLDN